MRRANLFDYVSWKGDFEFDQSPFNPVDNIIFSQLSYLPMDDIVPGPDKDKTLSIAALAKLYAEKRNSNHLAPRDVMAINAASVVNAIGTIPRYEGCGLFGYVNNTDPGEEKQFSAFCTVIGRDLPSRKLLVVYRGTDTSFVGWKEDLNMAFVSSIPAQKEAVSYLEKVAMRCPYPLILAGHSKGGNLAIYASAFCDKAVQARITAVYSNDSPGFHSGVIQSDGYKAILGRVHAFVPQSSFVGMLLEHGKVPIVIKSTATAWYQHDLCSWEVTHNSLSCGGELTPQSRLVNNIVHEWIGKFGEEQRYKFIEALYKILVSTHANSFAELGSDWQQAAVGIIGGLKNIDGSTKKLMAEILGELFKTASKNIIEQRRKTGRKNDKTEALWGSDLPDGGIGDFL